MSFLAACQILPKEHRPAAYTRASIIKQAEDSERESTLARSTLAYKSQSFPGENFNSGLLQHVPLLWIID